MSPDPWRLRLLTWNIHKCRGSDRRSDPARILKVIRDADPDVVVLQEADERFGRRRGTLTPEGVEATCGLKLIRSSGARPRSIGWHGNVMLVRPDIDVASMTNISLPSLEPRGAMIWRLRSGDHRVTVVGAHLGLVAHWRKLQAREIARRLEREDDVSTVIAGDMNEWRRGGRSLEAIEALLGSRPVGGPSFPSGKPFLALDKVAAGKGATIASWEVLESGPASDHRPLLACVYC